jgi:pantoate--beta-alanine ligase
MYPHGFATWIVPAGPAVAGLEDNHRPSFFRGVATVVAKLLLQCLPDAAVFGEKDYQQLKVVEHLVNDLAIPVEIIAAPTIREPDGLAMSSRNAYLTGADRQVAPKLYATLRQAADRIRSGAAIESAMAQGRESLTQVGFVLDYFEARDAETLAVVSEQRSAAIRLLAAAKLGSTRLIDNISV